MDEIAQDLKKKGKKSYIIVNGLPNDVGVFGYISCTKEFVKQLSEMKVKIDYVITTTGSGITHAALILGKKLYNQKY